MEQTKNSNTSGNCAWTGALLSIFATLHLQDTINTGIPGDIGTTVSFGVSAILSLIFKRKK